MHVCSEVHRAFMAGSQETESGAFGAMSNNSDYLHRCSFITSFVWVHDGVATEATPLIDLKCEAEL